MAAGATYEPIATTTLGSAAATITFSSIAASWTDLRLIVTSIGSNTSSYWMRYNSDSGSNYSLTELYGDGTTAGSTKGNSRTAIFPEYYNANIATVPNLTTFDIFSYAGSTYKTCLITSNIDNNGSGYVNRTVGLWSNTSAITTIVLGWNSTFTFNTGTTATLYGIKAA